MSKPVSMKDAAQAVRDARRVLAVSMPSGASDDERGAVLAVIVREFLDNEYVNDLDGDEDAGEEAVAPEDRIDEARHALLRLLKKRGIHFTAQTSESAPWDFYLSQDPVGGRTKLGYYVVIELTPGSRQDDVARLFAQGGRVIVLDWDDLGRLDAAPGAASAGIVINGWLRGEKTAGATARHAAGFYGLGAS